VRLADQPSVEVDVLVAAAPHTVWALVADVTRIGEWSPECVWARWVEDDAGAGDVPGSGRAPADVPRLARPVVGARFVGQQRRRDVQWKSMSVVTEVEPGRSFAWAVGDPAAPAATWRFDLFPEAGGTRLVQRAVLGPGPSRLSQVIAQHPHDEARIVAARLEEHRRNMTATLEGIRQAAETASPASA
jgi:uncharacterized protein YndB with AHSA1/START domain